LSIVLAIVLTLAAVSFVAWPLVRRREYTGSNVVTVVDPALEELLFAREVTVAALKDLAFDLNMGKLSNEDYERLDRQYRARAVGILQKLEQFEHAATNEELEQWIEDAVRAVRQEGTSKKSGDRSGGTNYLPAASSHEMRKRIVTSAKCPSCGRSYGVGDRFCSSCGVALPQLCSCCGGTSDHDARFCVQCGTELATA